jgi:hypothetical protein
MTTTDNQNQHERPGKQEVSSDLPAPIRGSAVATIVESIEPMNRAMTQMKKMRVRPDSGELVVAIPNPFVLAARPDVARGSDGTPPREVLAVSPLVASSKSSDAPACRRSQRVKLDLNNKTVRH